jgi:hypothetical protein
MADGDGMTTDAMHFGSIKFEEVKVPEKKTLTSDVTDKNCCP